MFPRGISPTSSMSERSDGASSTSAATIVVARSFSSRSRPSCMNHSIWRCIPGIFTNLPEVAEKRVGDLWAIPRVGHIKVVLETLRRLGRAILPAAQDQNVVVKVLGQHLWSKRESESLAGLQNQMRWWFSASDHQVQILLLVKLEETYGTIILKWEEEAGGARPGATTTRHAAALQPVLRQTVTITRDATAGRISCNMTPGGLVLGFKPLFPRNPGPEEGDIVLSVEKLQNYANNVWEGM